ncbi:MAG: DJ-1/PfpI family protein [Gammaproteobacteria bacterium]|nr:MAG: DJ-1/PfpI family protein [Gammaproteobacteria bacterium]
MNVAIYIYDEAEVLDFSGPYEVFSTASRLSDEPGLFSVFLVAEKQQTITARGGYLIQPHCSIDDHPDIDLLVVVGGVHAGELEKVHVLEWIKEQATRARVVASVCTGAFLLAEAGVLSTQTVTTHWEDIPDLRTSYPELNVVENRRWVDEGDIITSGGISAGIDMSLHLVSKVSSPELAERTARQMEFAWSSS